MAGMSDLGGVKFFNLSVETPNGDLEVLQYVLEGRWLTAAVLMRMHTDSVSSLRVTHPRRTA